jgi:hypothetical protein
MGMYDNIICKKELPLTEELKSFPVKWDEIIFQTKDLENCLIDYFISEDGELFEEVVEREYIYYTEEEKKSKDFKSWNLFKDVIEKNKYNKKIDYHGKILFYTTENISDTEDVWVDFEAYFIYGKLDQIKLTKVEKYKSRKISNDKFWEEYNKELNSFKFKLKKNLGWFWFWKKVSHAANKIANFFHWINMIVIRYFL